jgi:hypothetical protein
MVGMKVFEKCIIGLLVSAIVGLALPQSSFCDNKGRLSKPGQKTITRHAPVMMSTPEEEITKAMAGSNGKSSKWLWIGLGVVALGGLAAAGGGGGGGGESPQTPGGNNDGSISVGW